MPTTVTLDGVTRTVAPGTYRIDLAHPPLYRLHAQPVPEPRPNEPMTIATKPITRDRARGLLLGLALGDALGASFEGRDSVDPVDLVAEELAPSGLVHTDDTALALVIADTSPNTATPPS